MDTDKNTNYVKKNKNKIMSHGVVRHKKKFTKTKA